jgi:hypothetical protein
LTLQGRVLLLLRGLLLLLLRGLLLLLRGLLLLLLRVPLLLLRVPLLLRAPPPRPEPACPWASVSESGPEARSPVGQPPAL